MVSFDIRANLLTIFFLFIALILALTRIHASPGDPTLSRYHVTNDPVTLKEIAISFEVTRRTSAGFEVIVPMDRRTAFLALAPGATLLEEDISSPVRAMRARWDNAYHDSKTVQEEIQRFAREYSDIANVSSYGKSHEGRPLWVLKVSDNVQQEENEPQLMITAATHGDEIISVEVLLGIAKTLVENYKKDARLSALVDHHAIYFIPVVNADGYFHQTRYANGVDPNREYPGPNHPNDHPNECVAELLKFFHSHNIKGSIDMHAYGGLIMYPWAYTGAKPEAPYDKEFALLTSQMAAINGYTAGQIADFVFPSPGSSADYYFWKNKTLALGLEIADSKTPEPSLIPKFIQENLESTFHFIEYFK